MLLLGSSGTGSHGEIAKAVDFDGTNDYLSRASDLTGNADGKTFTFSAWVWNTAGSPGDFYKSSSRFRIDITSSNLRITAQDSAANPVLVYTNTNFTSQIEIGTFYHVLISVDLTNVSKRHVYVNDVAIAGGSWGTYTNSNIDFTNNTHGVGENFKGRLAHIFLDYQYRDLSVEANRRLFITADRKPAQGQAALNPILYLPMDDPTTAHVNQGTGGNFTLNGVIARSGRGPNQFNVPYSYFTGAVDYLSRTTALSGVADGKQFTFSTCFMTKSGASARPLVLVSSSGGNRNRLLIYRTSKYIYVYGYGADDTCKLELSSPDVVVDERNYHIVISVDMTDPAKCFMVINGVSVTLAKNTYVNANINFNTANQYVNSDASGNKYDYPQGNVFFHTSYIDLSAPTNLAKFVTGTGIDAKPADLGANGELPFGTPPLIYLPMYGNNAGKNYGTGGDFTVNSGPYPGARGPNEFWGNKADFDGSTGYLARTSALSGVSDGKTFSCSFSVNIDVNANRYIFLIANGASERLRISWTSAAPTFEIAGTTSGGSSTLYATCGTTLSAGTQYFVHICIDLTNTANRKVYINNALDSTTWTTYNNNTMELSAPNQRIGIDAGTTSKLDGKLSEFYFTTDYIDFSQEANRLLFRDAFGNPTDLPAAIAKGTVPNPAIYMRFDPANQGLNSGTGGDFTKSGTITDGGQL